MAIKIEAGPDTKRTDGFAVDPNAVVVDEKFNGRKYPRTDAEIVELAESMLDKGQRTPVECRRLPDSRLQLTFGYTRCAAARLIRKGFTDHAGTHRQDKEFLLKVVVFDCNDETAFTHNIIENAKRFATSPIDDAHNHQILRDRYSYSDLDIARVYGHGDVSKINRFRRLLMLPEEQQRLVHDGNLSVHAALDLLDIPETDRSAAIAAATGTNGKVKGSAVRKAARRANENGQSGKKKPRSMAELRAWFGEVAADGDLPESVRKLFSALTEFSLGERSEKSMNKLVGELKG